MSRVYLPDGTSEVPERDLIHAHGPALPGARCQICQRHGHGHNDKANFRVRVLTDDGRVGLVSVCRRHLNVPEHAFWREYLPTTSEAV